MSIEKVAAALDLTVPQFNALSRLHRLPPVLMAKIAVARPAAFVRALSLREKLAGESSTPQAATTPTPSAAAAPDAAPKSPAAKALTRPNLDKALRYGATGLAGAGGLLALQYLLDGSSKLKPADAVQGASAVKPVEDAAKAPLATPEQPAAPAPAPTSTSSDIRNSPYALPGAAVLGSLGTAGLAYALMRRRNRNRGVKQAMEILRRDAAGFYVGEGLNKLAALAKAEAVPALRLMQAGVAAGQPLAAVVATVCPHWDKAAAERFVRSVCDLSASLVRAK